MNKRIAEKTYAGVLGKIIGVFYGRPIEGWPYDKIRETFGVVDHFVYKEAGTPLIVADDDVAGTFTFLNTLEDCGDIRSLTAREFGEAWLDYVIENKTIFWWGGLGRSTEHTAYLRLKSGIPAPMSGSIETNGQAVAEQIGAQIFMDALPMVCPMDPVMAKKLVKACASVSHDGIAVEAACFLGAMESLAYEIRDLNELLDAVIDMGVSERLGKIISDVRKECAKTQDFREVRDWLEEYYGYRLYPGNCHVIPNFALILAALLLGGDDFAKAMQICVSWGWDTDCNGANLGCINGIRLGLDAIDEKFDFRGPIADRLYNISANGGGCVTDAVQQTRRILAQSRRLYGEEAEPEETYGNQRKNGYGEGKRMPRFAFEYPGAVQGFEPCPYFPKGSAAKDAETTEYLQNGNRCGLGDGLLLRPKNGICAVSAPTMLDLRDRQASYCLTASPTLYAGQTVEAEIELLQRDVKVQLYLVYYDFNNEMQVVKGPESDDVDGADVDGADADGADADGADADGADADGTDTDGCRYRIFWKIPDTGGMPIARIGVCCKVNGSPETRISGESVSGESLSGDGAPVAILRSMDWDGAPEHFEISGYLRNYKIGLNMAMESFVSSAKQYHFDSRATFAISHPEQNGAVTTGTEQWKDYSVKSSLKPSIHRRFGLIGRARGHRRYYGLVLWDQKFAGIICKKGSWEICLAKVPFIYEENVSYDMELTMKGNRITGRIGQVTLEAEDETYSCGGAGFLVDEGTALAYGFTVEERQQEIKNRTEGTDR